MEIFFATALHIYHQAFVTRAYYVMHVNLATRPMENPNKYTHTRGCRIVCRSMYMPSQAATSRVYYNAETVLKLTFA